jgi:dienelactone hydrolase
LKLWEEHAMSARNVWIRAGALLTVASIAAVMFLVAPRDQTPVGAADGGACGGVGGTIRTTTKDIPQQGGGTLPAKLFAPDASLLTGDCPAVSMLPGGGAPISSVEWAANRLAANGYVVIITDPAANTTTSYDIAAKSGIDCLVSSCNTYLSDTDTDAIGVAGWSLGGRSLTKTQETDLRVDAVVEWDNLALSEDGDEGSPACSNAPGIVRNPRVPLHETHRRKEDRVSPLARQQRRVDGGGVRRLQPFLLVGIRELHSARSKPLLHASMVRSLAQGGHGRNDAACRTHRAWRAGRDSLGCVVQLGCILRRVRLRDLSGIVRYHVDIDADCYGHVDIDADCYGHVDIDADCYGHVDIDADCYGHRDSHPCPRVCSRKHRLALASIPERRLRW